MLEYRIKVKNGSGEYIGEFDTFKDLRFGRRFNNYRSASFAIPVLSEKAASLVFLRVYTIEIYRDNVLVWAGEQASRRGDLKSNDNSWVIITCYDWLERYNKRRTGASRVFDQTDAGQIAATLIEETQDQTNGDFGTTIGTIEETMPRDRTYENDNIMESIINLTNVINGFDFEFTPYNVFNVYETLGSDRTDSIIFKHGFNMQNVTIDEDFVTPINRAIVLGEQNNEDDLVRIVRDNTASQDVYKLREDTVPTREVSEQETLEEKGDSMLRKYGLPLLKLDIDVTAKNTPNITQFNIGDIIKVIVKYGFYDINRSVRVFGWDINLTNKNEENLSLILGDFTLI